MRPIGKAAPFPILVKGKRHYEIEEILDSRYCQGKLQYRVKWKGYPLGEAQWVSATNVRPDEQIS